MIIVLDISESIRFKNWTVIINGSGVSHTNLRATICSTKHLLVLDVYSSPPDVLNVPHLPNYLPMAKHYLAPDDCVSQPVLELNGI
jgi:hypothetical protein